MKMVFALFFAISIAFANSAYACRHHHPGHGHGHASPNQPSEGEQAALEYKALMQDGETELIATFEVPPLTRHKHTMTIVFRDPRTGAKKAVDGDLKAELWMPDMGHGSSPTLVERIDESTFQVRDVYFMMRGRWQIHFSVSTANSDPRQTMIELFLRQSEGKRPTRLR